MDPSPALLPVYQNVIRGLQLSLECCGPETSVAAREAVKSLVLKETIASTETSSVSLFDRSFHSSTTNARFDECMTALSSALHNSDDGIHRLQAASAQLNRIQAPVMQSASTDPEGCVDVGTLAQFLSDIIPLLEQELLLRKRLVSHIIVIDTSDSLECKRFNALWRLQTTGSEGPCTPCLAAYTAANPGWLSVWIARLRTSVKALLHT